MKSVFRWLNYVVVAAAFSVEKFIMEPERFAHQVKQRIFGYQAVKGSRSKDIAGSHYALGWSKLTGVKPLQFLIETGNYQEFDSAYSKLSLVGKIIYFRKLFW